MGGNLLDRMIKRTAAPLAADELTYDVDALAFVGFSGIEGVNGSGDFAHHLLVGTFNCKFGVFLDGNGDAFKSPISQGGFTEGDIQDFALHGCAETNTLDFDLLLEAFDYADDHVVDNRTCGSIHGIGMTALVDRTEAYLIVDYFNFNGAVERLLKFTLRAIDAYGLPIDRDICLIEMGTGSLPILLIVAVG